jgi:hypothetical protein
MEINVGDLVFAPFKETMWPGKLLKINIVGEVKLYTESEHVFIPIRNLVPFNY